MSEAARKRPECAWFRVAWPESLGSYIRGGLSGVADRPYGNLEKSSVMQNKEKVYLSRKLKGKKSMCVCFWWQVKTRNMSRAIAIVNTWCAASGKRDRPRVSLWPGGDHNLELCELRPEKKRQERKMRTKKGLVYIWEWSKYLRPQLIGDFGLLSFFWRGRECGDNGTVPSK